MVAFGPQKDTTSSAATMTRRGKKKGGGGGGGGGHGGGHGGGGHHKRHKHKHHGGGGGGGSGSGTGVQQNPPKPSGPVTDMDTTTLFDRASKYGAKGKTPYFNTPQGILDANQHQAEYLDYVYSKGGLTPGSLSPFGQWMENTYFPQVIQGFNNAMGVNPDINFPQYMQTLGVPQNSRKWSNSYYQTSLGTGQAQDTVGIDTGNPFTSSSPGMGGPLRTPPQGNLHVPGSMTGGLVGGGLTGMPKGNPFGGPQGRAATVQDPVVMMQKKRKHKHKNKGGGGGNGNGAGGAQPQQTFNQANPPSGAGATAPNLGTAIADARKAFLALSPAQRGENATGYTAPPGRWSAWG